MAALPDAADTSATAYPAPTVDYDEATQGYASLPGQQMDCGESECGNVTGAEACPHAQEDPDNHHLRKFYQTCEGRTCATGYEDWISDRADKISHRLLDGLEAYARYAEKLGAVKHVIFSPPPDEIDNYQGEDGYNELLKDAYAHAGEAGMDGGVAIPHLWRLSEGIKARLRGEGYGIGEDNGGLWQGVHDDALRLGDWRAYVTFSPHVHILGTGWLENAEEFHDRTGWVYNNKRKRTTKGSVRATAEYILSHASLVEGRRALRWWGAFAPNKLAREEVLRSREEKTCECGETIYEYPTSKDGDVIGWQHQRVPAERVEKRILYRIVGKPPPEGERC